ncbi:muts domain V-domain-containing protein [Blastocladiella britannica]|nr:muts domain V-domain-containing protein [Blastocladiella britannica]
MSSTPLSAGTPSRPLSSTAGTPSSSRSKKVDKSDMYAFLDDIRDADGRRPADPEYDPTTLYIPPASWTKFSQFEQQYWEVKSKVFDTMLLFQKGSFAEAYCFDADICQREFDMKVSDNGRGAMRMSGFPVTAVDEWAAKFVARGYRVSLVLQTPAGVPSTTSTPGKGKPLLTRSLQRIITPATIDPTAAEAMHILAVVETPTAIGAVFVELSAGAMTYTSIPCDGTQHRALETLCSHASPRELVVGRGNLSAETKRLVLGRCAAADVSTLPVPAEASARVLAGQACPAFDAEGAGPATALAAGLLVSYLARLKQDGALKSAAAVPWNGLRDTAFLRLDAPTLDALDLLTGQRSLLSLLDHCATPFGRRTLRLWLQHPPCRLAAIEERADAIAELCGGGAHVREKVEAMLKFKGVPDLERAVVKLMTGTARDVAVMANVVSALHDAAMQYTHLAAAMSAPIFGKLISPSDLEALVAAAEELQTQVQDLTQGGDSAETAAIKDQMQALARKHGATLKDTSKCALLELAKSVVPNSSWKFVSGTKAVSRYSMAELDLLYEKRKRQEATQSDSRDQLVDALWAAFAAHGDKWKALVRALAVCDVLNSLALASMHLGFTCRPTFERTQSAFIDAVGVWNPIIPNCVPNDIVLGGSHMPRAIVLQGSNMSGKSTIMRSMAYCVILAQLGSLVPAVTCRLGVFDAVLTRMGARDDFNRGLSTLAVEMEETSRILRESTPQSLVLLDEVGRGTNTLDGESLASAALLSLLLEQRPCVVFATHFHSLARTFAMGPLTSTVCVPKVMVTKRVDQHLAFEYTIADGLTDSSGGVEIARSCGLPESLLQMARSVSDTTAARDRDGDEEKEGGYEDVVNLAMFARLLMSSC